MIDRLAIAARIAGAAPHEMIPLIDELAREHDAETHVRREGGAVEARFRLAGAEGCSATSLSDAARDWARRMLERGTEDAA